MKITEINGRDRIDEGSGSLVMYRRFEVDNGNTYTVEIEVSHSGCNQNEKCTCPAFKYSKGNKNCKHIQAVFDGGFIVIDYEN